MNMQKIYLAPLQGFTDYIFRNAYNAIFGDIDCYYTPYILFEKGGEIRNSKLKEVLFQNNNTDNFIPQILVANAEETKDLIDILIEEGHSSVNINMGCPYPMVTKKGRGSALLSSPNTIAEILDVACGYDNMKVSVKCRIGFDNREDFGSVIDTFNNYNLDEVIVHPRLATQMYDGRADFDFFKSIYKQIKAPVCYNGDICTPEDYNKLTSEVPEINSVMIGRGILQNPLLVSDIKGKEYSKTERVSMLRKLHDTVYEEYSGMLSGDAHLLSKMYAFWTYFSELFPDNKKLIKAIKKCKRKDNYNAIVFRSFMLLK
jgi:tRNA-dihydrouridine synthase